MQKICSTVSLFHASTCFEHHVLIVRRSKFYYTASGIITLKQVSGLKLLNYFSNFSNFRPLTCFSLMIPGTV